MNDEMKSEEKNSSAGTKGNSQLENLKDKEVGFDKLTSESPVKDETPLKSEVDSSIKKDETPLSKIDGVSSEEVDENVLEKLEGLNDKDSIEELDKLTGQNDSILEKAYLSGLIQQEEKEIFFEVENIYYNPEKRLFKNRLKLRKDPPVLVIRDSEGIEVEFKLTENLTDELTETLKQVKRAYYGFSSPSDIHVPSKTSEKIIYLIKKNKVKLIVTIFILLFLFTLNLM